MCFDELASLAVRCCLQMDTMSNFGSEDISVLYCKYCTLGIKYLVPQWVFDIRQDAVEPQVVELRTDGLADAPHGR